MYVQHDAHANAYVYVPRYGVMLVHSVVGCVQILISGICQIGTVYYKCVCAHTYVCTCMYILYIQVHSNTHSLSVMYIHSNTYSQSVMYVCVVCLMCSLLWIVYAGTYVRMYVSARNVSCVM